MRLNIISNLLKELYSKRLEPIIFAHCFYAFFVTRHNDLPLDDELIIQFGIIIERHNSPKFVRDLQRHGLKV